MLERMTTTKASKRKAERVEFPAVSKRKRPRANSWVGEEMLVRPNRWVVRLKTRALHCGAGPAVVFFEGAVAVPVAVDPVRPLEREMVHLYLH